MRAYRIHHDQTLVINALDTGIFTLKGALTFATINKATSQRIDFTRSGSAASIDLLGITHSDSAGLALMIEWLKISKKQHCTLSFINIPAQLQALAKISGINENLTLQTDHKSTLDTTTWIN